MVEISVSARCLACLSRCASIKMSRAPRGVVYAGMYAPGDEYRAAWQDWFSVLSSQYLKQYYSSLELSFAVNDQAYTDKNLIAAQTCGYPFIKRWIDSHTPVAVPVFDIPGCKPTDIIASQNGQYWSWFITFAQNKAQSLDQFQGKRLVVNSENSNSGMNVLRYAVSQLTSSTSFFSERFISGSHQKSMQLLADRKADIAAIDVISYSLIADLEPTLIKRLKIVGRSVSTMGLPFICAKQSDINHQQLCAAMNAAVSQMEPKFRKQLRLKGFAAVSSADYEKIRQLEESAIAAGYPDLQ